MGLYGFTDEYIEWHWSMRELLFYVTKGLKWQGLKRSPLI